MPRGVPYGSTRDALVARLKEIEDGLAAFDRRQKYMSHLKAWIEKRGLTHLDVLAMYRQMKPARADKPVKSERPLKPGLAQRSLKNAKRGPKTGRYYIREAGPYVGDVKSIRYLSPDGRFVWGGIGHYPGWFADYIKKGGQPQDLLLPGKQLPEKHAKLNGKAAHA